MCDAGETRKRQCRPVSHGSVERSLLYWFREIGEIGPDGGWFVRVEANYKISVGRIPIELGAVLKKSCGEMTKTATGCNSPPPGRGLDYGRVTDVTTGHVLKHAPSTPQTYLSFLPLPQTPGQSLQSVTTIPVLSAQLSCFVFKH